MRQKRENTYVIIGKPVAWARPGRTKYHSQAYDTQRREKEEYGWNIKLTHGSEEPFKGPLELQVTFFMPMTGSAMKRHKERLESYHVFTPDLSNLVKFIEDASTGILYEDDALIASIVAKKVWASTARTEFTIREL